MTTGISIAHTASLKELGLLDNAGLPVGGGLAVTTLNAPANASTDSSTWATLTLGKHTIVTGLTGDTTIKLPAGASKAAWKITVDGNQLSGYRVTLLAAGSDTISYDSITTHSSAKIVNAGDWVEGSWVGTYWALNNGATRGGVPSSYSTTTRRSKVLNLQVSGTNWVSDRAVGYVYADSTGKWFLHANIAGHLTTQLDNIDLIISDIVAKASISQAVSSHLWHSSSGHFATQRSVISKYNATQSEIYAVAVTAPYLTNAEFTVDIELDSEPTIYTTAANMENVLSSDVYILPYVPGVSAGLVPAASFPPTQQKFTSGSGTYTTPTGVRWIRVRMVGGGGGGGGGGTTSGTAATDGGDSTFGGTLLSAGGGAKGARNAFGGAGGTASMTAGPVGLNLKGGAGQTSMGYSGAASTLTPIGGHGGASAFAGGGYGGTYLIAANGISGYPNTGAGGGGGGVDSVSNGSTGAGGGSGSFIDAIITTPSATYAYAVGAGGSGQAGGANGGAGGDGGSGIIIVEEHYI